jgi:hypothetical protein
VTAPDPLATESAPEPMVIVRRDVLERLEVSVVHQLIHHQCSALSRDARKAYDALGREDAAGFVEEHVEKWLRYQRLEIPAVALLSDLAEHVERSNRHLEAIKELLARPDAPVQDRRALFWDLHHWATRLTGMTHERSLHVRADLNEMIDQAGLAEPAGAEVMPFRNRPSSNPKEVMDRETRHEQVAGNTQAPVAPVVQLHDKAQREAVEKSSESGLRNRQSNDLVLSLWLKQAPTSQSTSQKEQPHGSTP